MNLIKLIKEKLNGLSIPVSYLLYEGDEKTYINFYIWDERGSLYADDKEIETQYAIQISIFSDDKLRYYNLCEELKKTMKDTDFIKNDVSPDLYEKDTKLYHKAFRYLYYMDTDS